MLYIGWEVCKDAHMTTYTAAAAPRAAWMYDYSCTCCGESLKKPVFLNGPTGVHAYGSTCAAELLHKTVAGVRRACDAAEAKARDDEYKVERIKSNYGHALTAELERLNGNYMAQYRPEWKQAMSDFQKRNSPLRNLRNWIELVAWTGDVDYVTK